MCWPGGVREMPPAACWNHCWTMTDAMQLLSLWSGEEWYRWTGRSDGDRDDDWGLSATVAKGRTAMVRISGIRTLYEEVRIFAPGQQQWSGNRRKSDWQTL